MNAQCESKRRRDRVELLCIVSVVLSNKQSLLAVEQKQAERARFGAACLHTLCRAFFLQNSFEIRWVAYLDNARTCFSCGANGDPLHPAKVLALASVLALWCKRTHSAPRAQTRVHTSRIAASTRFETMLRKLSVMLPRAVDLPMFAF